MDITLIMFKDDGAHKKFEIESGKTIIGRQEDCGLRILLAEVSRRHAVLIVQDDTVTIRDLGSANGTYVNNKKISEQELDAGDHVVIGPVVFTIQIDGEPEEVKPVKTRLEARKAVAKADDSGVVRPDDLFADEDEEDPISELEALASTDDTTAMDLDDSEIPGLDDSHI